MNSATQNAFTGKHMLAIMIGFFAVVLAANLSLVYFASHSWTGLVVKNSYVASQEFDTKTAQLETAEAGVNVRASDDHGKLQLVLTDTSGNMLTVSNVVAVLGRPTHEGEDTRLSFDPAGDGTFVAQHALLPGVWVGDVYADVGSHPGWMRPLRITIGE